MTVISAQDPHCQGWCGRANLLRVNHRAAMFLTSLLSGCSDFCTNEVVRSAPSPDGRQLAILFLRDCGATTALSSQISILPRGEAVSGSSGNLFVSVPDQGTAWIEPPARGPVDFGWVSAKHLQIRHARGMNIFKRREWVDSVRVSYVVLDGSPAPWTHRK